MKIIKRGDITFAEADYTEEQWWKSFWNLAWVQALTLFLAFGLMATLLASYFGYVSLG